MKKHHIAHSSSESIAQAIVTDIAERISSTIRAVIISSNPEELGSTLEQQRKLKHQLLSEERNQTADTLRMFHLTCQIVQLQQLTFKYSEESSPADKIILAHPYSVTSDSWPGRSLVLCADQVSYDTALGLAKLKDGSMRLVKAYGDVEVATVDSQKLIEEYDNLVQNQVNLCVNIGIDLTTITNLEYVDYVALGTAVGRVLDTNSLPQMLNTQNQITQMRNFCGHIQPSANLLSEDIEGLKVLTSHLTELDNKGAASVLGHTADNQLYDDPMQVSWNLSLIPA